MRKIELSNAIITLFTIMLGTGYVSKYPGGTMIILLVMIMYLIVSRKVVLPQRLTVCIIFFLVYIGLKSIRLGGYRAVSSYHSIISEISGLVATCFFIIMLGSMKNKMTERRQIKLFLFCYHFVLNLSMAYMLFTDGRSLYRSSGAAEVGFLASGNFVVYAMVFSLTFMYLIIFGENRKRNRLFLLLFLDNAMFIVMTQYMTQLIFIVVGVGIMLILKYVRKKSIAVILFALCCLLPFVMPSLFSDLLRFVNEHFLSSSADFSMRINEIISAINGDFQGTIDLQSRIDLQNRSLNVFYEYPFFGIPFEEYNVLSVVIGGHAEWTDMLGRLGIVGTLLWASVFYPGAKRVMVDFAEGKFHFIISTIFFVYGFFNPFLTIFFYICLLYTSGILKYYEEVREDRRLETREARTKMG